MHRWETDSHQAPTTVSTIQALIYTCSTIDIEDFFTNIANHLCQIKIKKNITHTHTHTHTHIFVGLFFEC